MSKELMVQTDPTEAARMKRAREELQSLQSSGVFERSSGLWTLLEYVCTQYFEGRAEQLKEYTIAVEAFGRPPEFDKKRDSIVRVEAHRLRKRLDQYYQLEGANRPVQISIPPGQYAPRFIFTSEPEGPIERVSVPGNVVLYKWWWIAAAILSAAVVGAGFWFRSPADVRIPVPVVEASVAPVVGGAVAGIPVRIMAGSQAGESLDSMGRTWSADRYYSDGEPSSVPFRSILRTKDPTIFLKRRLGNFRYDIPLAPGQYEMRLFFAETNYGENNLDGGGETSRLFNVMANGKVLLNSFDTILDAAGANTADVKVFKQISPAADGKLHLQFQSSKDRAFVNAIELIAGNGNKLHPIRFIARENGFTDSKGTVWLPESYVAGGRLTLRQEEVTGTPDAGIYQGERYGNFSYAIPVAPGRYTVILHFAETWHGPQRGDNSGVGSRVFDVFCNGVALLQSFDIYKEAGKPFRAVEKRFTGLQANAQGKLNLSFVPQVNYACVNAIEVLDEAN